jgi:DNA (cytosine-5)-methyltransferase 1
MIEWDAAMDMRLSARNVALIPPAHLARLKEAAAAEGAAVATGYRRIRNGRQVMELRFDGIAGCLRTPRGGSGRQFVVTARDGAVHARLMTIREAKRLMGVREAYWLPAAYNDAYRALGDAVAVPVARFLTRRLLAPLAARISPVSGP